MSPVRRDVARAGLHMREAMRRECRQELETSAFTGRGSVR